MIHKTRGIVFRFTRYGETSIIVNIFTELFGLQSYIVNGVRSGKSSANKIALYQPLTLLDMVVYHREHANINRIKEIKCLYPYKTILHDVKRSTLVMFINEIVNKVIKGESDAGELFDFLYESLKVLDTIEHSYENFHLIFLLRLGRYLGFGAQRPQEILAHHVVSSQDELVLKHLIAANYTDHIEMSNAQRRTLLDVILKFYVRHIEGLGEIKSVQILREILS